MGSAAPMDGALRGRPLKAWFSPGVSGIKERRGRRGFVGLAPRTRIIDSLSVRSSSVSQLKKAPSFAGLASVGSGERAINFLPVGASRRG